MSEAQVLVGFLGILTYALLVGAGDKVIEVDHKLVLGRKRVPELVRAKACCGAGLGRVVQSGMPILLVMYNYTG